MNPVDLSAHIQAAAGRAEWLLWGKAQPDPTAATPVHALLAHIVDVTCVAEALLIHVLPRSTVERLVAPMNVPTEAAIRWLCYFIALHDLGKATPAFQGKFQPAVGPLTAAGFDFPRSASARTDHGALGVALVTDVLDADLPSNDDAFRIARAVASHHGTPLSDAHAKPLASGEAGRADVWQRARREMVRSLRSWLEVNRLPELRVGPDWGFYSILAGVTSVADWIGSMAEVFAYELPPASIDAYASMARARVQPALAKAGFRPMAAPRPSSFEELFGFAPRPLQTVMEQLAPAAAAPVCAIVEAPMGEGKTEAALYVAQALAAREVATGAYVGLPTQATANQMFSRLEAFLRGTWADARINLQLIHGEAVFDVRVRKLLAAVYGEGEGLVCEPWFLSKKRSLLAPFGAGTIDQALLAVLRTRHAFVRQLGLAGKTIVLDEVHAYDAYTSTILRRLVAWLGALGSSVVILSATLPETKRRQLLAAFNGNVRDGGESAPYPRVSWLESGGLRVLPIATGRPPSTVRLTFIEDSPSSVETTVARAIAGGGVIGVIRNTVQRAQATYRELTALKERGELPSDTELLVLHARFPSDDRRTLENELIAKAGKTGVRPSRLIVIGTQVLEQSLDIDLDALFTDSAPIDLILQRAGRVHRHARDARPSLLRDPAVTVVVPEGPFETSSFEKVAAVYEPYIVRKSLLALRGREIITLPNDIEPLVHRVYEADDAEWTDVLALSKESFAKSVAEDAQLAETRAWRNPSSTEDPMDGLDLSLEDDDADVGKMLRAETRLGDESLEAVCLFGDDRTSFLDAGRTRPIDLSATPDAATVRLLAGRTVRLGHRGLFGWFKDTAPPEAWRDVSTLRRRRPLFFDASRRVDVGNYSLTLDAALGVVIERKEGLTR